MNESPLLAGTVVFPCTLLVQPGYAATYNYRHEKITHSGDVGSMLDYLSGKLFLRKFSDSFHIKQGQVNSVFLKQKTPYMAIVY